MQNFLSLWLNAGAQITHGDQVQSWIHLLNSFSNVFFVTAASYKFAMDFENPD